MMNKWLSCIRQVFHMLDHLSGKHHIAYTILKRKDRFIRFAMKSPKTGFMVISQFLTLLTRPPTAW
jgi:uncharacterized membrane protein